MHLIVCVDEQYGMSFAGRRQSMDRVLRERMLALVGDAPLWVSSYTAGQFKPWPENLKVDPEYLQQAGQGEYCFAEVADLRGCSEKIENIILYKWNRRYPADRRFPAELLEGRSCTQTAEFPGNSHENITQEVYTL